MAMKRILLLLALIILWAPSARAQSCSSLPALTGDVTTPVGSCATTLKSGTNATLTTPAINGGTISGTDASNADVTVSGSTNALTLAGQASEFTDVTRYLASGDQTTAVGLADTAAATNGGLVLFPPGNTWTISGLTPPTNVLWDFEGNPLINSSVVTGSSGTQSEQLLTGLLPGPHTGNNQALESVFMQAQGSNCIGAPCADFAESVLAWKQNYLTTTTPGEVDGINIGLRNGGPGTGTESGGDAINIGAVNLNGSGDTMLLEGVTETVNSTLTPLWESDIQIGAQDSRTGELAQYGTVYNAEVGSFTSGLLFQSTSPSRWNYVLQSSVGGSEDFDLTDTGTLDFWHSGGVQFSLLDASNALTVEHAGTRTLAYDNVGNLSMSPAGTWSSGLVITVGQTTTNAGNWYQATTEGTTGTTAPRA